ncbi:hypothetical protein CYMTET_16686 [Cymbomonas tetramitiformis]|uniref:Uncharacterized protein n=1 Tax=Cymbomonas tetramitiformis TaxID=36881 RepID=A0AAE0GBW5_9CHLO|nr:hypothetical protein CYMTET_16686 [Cymbomonas tetramitiformis]
MPSKKQKAKRDAMRERATHARQARDPQISATPVALATAVPELPDNYETPPLVDGRVVPCSPIPFNAQACEDASTNVESATPTIIPDPPASTERLPPPIARNLSRGSRPKPGVPFSSMFFKVGAQPDSCFHWLYLFSFSRILDRTYYTACVFSCRRAQEQKGNLRTIINPNDTRNLLAALKGNV